MTKDNKKTDLMKDMNNEELEKLQRMLAKSDEDSSA